MDRLDKSVRRGGRLDIDIRLDMPSDNDRFLIFKEHLRHLPNNINDEDLLEIARASSGFVSSDLA
jgi:SpoVK/Ycf46/Vps4 family AAA+-type ATPase